MSAPICGNCRHLDSSYEESLACLRIPDVNDRAPKEGEAATYDTEQYNSGLYVTRTFGCTLFEESQL